MNGLDPSGEYAMLARVRRALRALNAAIARGAEAAELTLQQQAFLLAVVGYGGRDVPLADVREELEMDQATTSELLRRLVRARLVARAAAPDRRAIRVAVTALGWTTFRRSVRTIRDEVQRAEHRGELGALGAELQAYLGFYLRRRSRARLGTISAEIRKMTGLPHVGQRGSGVRRSRPSERRDSTS